MIFKPHSLRSRLQRSNREWRWSNRKGTYPCTFNINFKFEIHFEIGAFLWRPGCANLETQWSTQSVSGIIGSLTNNISTITAEAGEQTHILIHSIFEIHWKQTPHPNHLCLEYLRTSDANLFIIARWETPSLSFMQYYGQLIVERWWTTPLYFFGVAYFGYTISTKSAWIDGKCPSYHPFGAKWLIMCRISAKRYKMKTDHCGELSLKPSVCLLSNWFSQWIWFMIFRINFKINFIDEIQK